MTLSIFLGRSARRALPALLLLASNSARAEFDHLWTDLYAQESARLTRPATMLFQRYSADCMTLPNRVLRARHDWEELKPKGYTRNQAMQTLLSYDNDYQSSSIAMDIPSFVSDRDVWKRTMEVCMHEAARRAAE
jgi:hypothetical protein